MFKRTVFLFLLLGFGTARGITVNIEKDGQTFPLNVLIQENIIYFQLDQLSDIFNGSFYWNPTNKKAVVLIEGHNLSFPLFSTYISADGHIYNLVYPTVFTDGNLYVPLLTFTYVLERVLNLKTSWDPENLTLTVSKKEVNITDIQAFAKSNGILVEISLSEQLRYEVYPSENNWININFFNGKVDTDFFGAKSLEGVKEVKAYQFEVSAQISLRMAKPFAKQQVFLASEPLRLQISLEDANPLSDPNGESSSDLKPDPEFYQNYLIDLVVIDAGHGGEDFGAMGPTGLTEKEATLDIAFRVEKLLKQAGYEVILTRKDDTFIALGDRTKIANQAGADLFISIHTNASRKRDVSGFETFFLARAKNDEARAAASLENSSIRFEKTAEEQKELSDLDFILLDMVQNEFLKESSNLAEIIQKQLEQKLDIPSRGVDQAGFFVLNNAYMPAVLVETAFISNRKEEALLKKPAFRQKIAESIVKSVESFKNKYEMMPR